MQHTTSTEPDLIHRGTYDPSSDKSLTTVLLDAFSEIKDVCIDELPPLQYSIDTDALEELFCPLQSGGFSAIGDVRFMYAGHSVEIHSTGKIQISEI